MLVKCSDVELIESNRNLRSADLEPFTGGCHRNGFSLDPFSARSALIHPGAINKDGVADLVTGNESDTSVLLNTGGTFLTTSSSENPSTLGQAVTLTVTVTASVGSWRTPTDTARFKDGTLTLGTVLLVNGQASLTTSSLGLGDQTIRTEYSGSTSFNRNQAQPIIQTVVP